MAQVEGRIHFTRGQVLVGIVLIVFLAGGICEASADPTGASGLFGSVMELFLPGEDVVREVVRMGLGGPLRAGLERETGDDPVHAVLGVMKFVSGVDLADPATYLASEMRIPEGGSEPPARGALHEAAMVPPIPQAREASPPRPESAPSTPPEVRIPEIPVERPREPEPVPEVPELEPWGSAPLVAVYYTHTSESFLDMSGVTHTRGTVGDIVAVGSEFVRALERQHGIPVVHSTKIHDYPQWSRAYGNAIVTARALVREHPSLRLVIDLHRDGFDPQSVPVSKARSVVTADIRGEQIARVLIVVTTDDFGLPHENWRENYETARTLHALMNRMYPGLSRGIDLRRDARFNQHVHEGALLLEIGACVSTEDEVMRTARLLANVVAEFLREERAGRL